ncbi:hypothetical protein EUTSA_v10006223mg [Eutrema salsugineum]|uniref:Phytocyanin domain-containing protein n=1 Tax=Eutrema salsugineum TaxID=72664 RepID=V4LNM8_EUTSA|nr:uclacyanin-3 isoform X1 [Eutrema salsugineum]ESQ44052.1 hypothetical protein EUTSA_v10006223mg [Eutrema salsugineum]
MGLTGAVAILLIASFPAIFAVTFQVGDTSGWESGVDYTTWVSGKTFRVGDTLEFKYGPTHSVSVVDKADFDACDSSAATEVFSDGDTSIDLTGVGTIHFICPTPGHCLGGMKLAIPVLAAVSSPATPSPPSSPRSSPPPSPRTPPSSTPPPLAPRSPRKPKTPSPSASPPANESESSTPSPSPSPTSQQSPSTTSPSPSPPNAASKGVMSYGMIGVTMVLMYNIMS